MDQNERNRLLAEDYRANGGVVSDEKFTGAPLLLLTTTGRASGREYLNPLMYLPDGERFVVFASHQGAEEDPDWFKNLVAAGEALVEVGTRRCRVRADVVTGEERDLLYRRHAERYPRFGEYEQRTSRVIPVVTLTPID
jgi:deazaflavin-dependent oxidoreductase (nitroreductase family)